MTTHSSRMPVLFIGHGSPMNAIDDNAWSRGFRTIGEAIPKPKAILSVSAHWYVPGTFLTANEQPETIHDFGGFPEPLFEMQYRARGDVALAKRIRDFLSAEKAELSTEWGLDHGTWTVLHHLRPQVDVPVLQLSIDAEARAETHLAIGRALAPLRDEGVLIMGSGNVTHNLRDAFRNLGRPNIPTPAWAEQFDKDIATAVEQRDHAFLARVYTTDTGRMNHPTPDHYLPLLYAAGASDPGDAVSYPIRGWEAGSLSMRSIRFG